MPLVDCPRCGIRQYAAIAYVAQPRCVACDAPLPRQRSEYASTPGTVRGSPVLRPTTKDSRAAMSD